MAVTSKATQDFVPIKEIRDNIVILKDGSLRLVLMASSINLALKSDDEQIGILIQFQNFLNSLEFSTQFFIQSRRLDIRPYLSLLDNRLKEEMNDLLKIQIREYMNFVKTVTKSANIMNKLFLVVVPYTPQKSVVSKEASTTGGFFSSFFNSKKNTGGEKLSQSSIDAFEEAKSQIEQRAGVVRQGLSRTGVRVVPLGTEELTELYYHLFNPGEDQRQVTQE